MPGRAPIREVGVVCVTECHMHIPMARNSRMGV